MLKSDTNEAIHAWRALLGQENVITEDNSQSPYFSSSTRRARVIPAVLLPGNKEEIIALLKIAGRHGISLYPISIGNNWGYGNASPVQNDCAVVSLSRMKKIIHFDEELGLIKVEPGVTFGELSTFLKQKKTPFLWPETGAGPETSLIGNVLEKGFGNGANADRFSTLMSFEAILADGSYYSSSNVSSQAMLAFYRWGVGPYLDGLFVQSNLAIIISATFSLRIKPGDTAAFFFNLKKGITLGQLTEGVHELSEKLGSTLVSLKIQNAHRTYLEILRDHGRREASTGDMSRESAQKWLENHSFSDWIVTGSLAGERKMVSASKKIFRKKISSYTSSVWIVNRRLLRLLVSLRKKLPEKLRCRFFFLVLMYRSLEITRNDRLTESLSPQSKAPKSGLIFFVAAMPMKKIITDNFLKRAEEIFAFHGMPCFLRILKMSEKVYHISLPIFFDKESKEKSVAAHDCYEKLYAMALEENVLPYRVGIDTMPLLFQSNKPFWQTAEKIKQALDPFNIISPGRYSTYEKESQQD